MICSHRIASYSSSVQFLCTSSSLGFVFWGVVLHCLFFSSPPLKFSKQTSLVFGQTHPRSFFLRCFLWVRFNLVFFFTCCPPTNPPTLQAKQTTHETANLRSNILITTNASTSFFSRTIERASDLSDTDCFPLYLFSLHLSCTLIFPIPTLSIVHPGAASLVAHSRSLTTAPSHLHPCATTLLFRLFSSFIY
jgi:hypothetical protein